MSIVEGSSGHFAFSIDLRPHRSLSRRGFFILMSALSGVSFLSGSYFAAHGAWPIFGFFGLDLLVLYFALRSNSAEARLIERIEIINHEMTVTQFPLHGPTRRWSFQPFWVQIISPVPEQGIEHLNLSSHGRTLAIGKFLSLQERIDLAATLKIALRQYRESLFVRT